MSDIFFGAASSRTAAAFQPTEVLVDVGEKQINPKIVRDGISVGTLEIDPDIFDDFFGGRPTINQKVVSQSIPPGTPVPEGTTVDLVMAEPGRLPLGVVSGVHIALAEQAVDDIYGTFIQDRPEVTRILARAGDSGTLSAGDETTLNQVFEQEGITLGTEPGQDVGAALKALQVAHTFRT